MHELSAERIEAVQTLIALGAGIDEQGAIRLLDRSNWDINQAATLLLEGIDQPEEAPKYSAERGAHDLGTSQSHRYRSRSPHRLRESPSIQQPARGALNASSSSRAVVPFVPPPTEIDLTGVDDEDEDLKRAISASMQEQPTNDHQHRTNTPSVPSIIVQGPKNIGEENHAIVPSQAGTGGGDFSQHEYDLSHALEESFTTHLEKDVYPEVKPDDRVRSPGFPLGLRTHSLKRLPVAYLLQALFSVPQVCETFARWRDNSPVPATPAGFPDDDRSRKYEKVLNLQRLFTCMDLSYEASTNIDPLLDTLQFPEAHLLDYNSPEHADELLTKHLALDIDWAFYHQSGMPLNISPPSNYRLLSHRTFSTDEARSKPPELAAEHDSATLCLLGIAGIDQESVALESSIFSLMLAPPIPQFFTHTAATICFSIKRPDLGPYGANLIPTLFKYPMRFYMDPYMIENMEIMIKKKDEQEHAANLVQSIGRRKEAFTKHEGKDTFGDMRKTIHYLEKVAGGREDPVRAQQLDIMAAKIKDILAHCEEELKRIDKEAQDAQASLDEMLNSPELRKHPYDLRAVIVSSGVIGRENIYAYLRSPTSGKWFKSCDATVTEVSAETVLTDPTGLHTNAGPYLLLYSRAVDHPLPSPLPWPSRIRHEIKNYNRQFKATLSPEAAAKLRREPVSPAASPKIARSELQRASTLQPQPAPTPTRPENDGRSKVSGIRREGSERDDAMDVTSPRP